MPKTLCAQWRISVNKKCYVSVRFGRQKGAVNRKYGHDTQGVAGADPARPTNTVPGEGSDIKPPMAKTKSDSPTTFLTTSQLLFRTY